jgi:hypothetical protein
MQTLTVHRERKIQINENLMENGAKLLDHRRLTTSLAFDDGQT